MKVAVVGGGSTYTPELVSGLTRLDVDEFLLEDVDPDRREVVGGMARRMLARQGFEGRLEVTGDLNTAVEGADYVLIQIRVGGQEARLRDETAPLACGCIGQETTGAGGFAKAMRTVPVVLEIAERVRERAAPEAWIVDFTNPVGIVTRALLDDGHRAVGLCNVAIGFQRRIAGWLGVEPDRVLVDQVGLNHLTWIRAVRLDGRDVLPELLAEHGDELAAEIELPRRVLDELGAIPSYYLHYFYAHDGSPLAGLAADDVVEVPARVGTDGPEPLPQEPLAPELLGLVQHVAAYERLTAQAATTRDPVAARKALLAHPLIGQVALVDELAETLVAAEASV